MKLKGRRFLLLPWCHGVLLLSCRREGRGREGSKEAQAERLRDGCRHSFLVSSALCDRNAGTQPSSALVVVIKLGVTTYSAFV